MRKRGAVLLQDEEESEINLTPMLDVVFIMLIFFIVTASFIKEAGIQVSRPDAPTGESQDNAAILVAISPSNEIWVDRRQVEPKNLRTHIERLHAENPKGGMVIQADEESTNDMLVVVMEAAKQVGISDVAIATDTE